MTVDFTFWASGNAVCVHAEFGISTVQVPRVHDSTAIVNGKVTDSISAITSQSRAAKYA